MSAYLGGCMYPYIVRAGGLRRYKRAAGYKDRVGERQLGEDWGNTTQHDLDDALAYVFVVKSFEQRGPLWE